MTGSSKEFDNFDAVVRRVFSVSHDEIAKREKQYKRNRKRAKQKRAKIGTKDRTT